MSVLRVNLCEIKNNFKDVKNLLNNNQKICVVLKANAYGLGSKKICKLLNQDADYFAVSSLKEYYEIKTISQKPILILDPVYDGVEKLLKDGAELTVSNFESLNIIDCVSKKLNIKAKVHIAINTGMNRFGFKTKSDILKLISIIKKSQNISVLGVFSHYFSSKNKIFAIYQYFLFNDYVKFFEKNFSKKPIFHLSNSAGVELFNGFDMVRVGIKIFDDTKHNTLSLESKIIDIQTLKKGESAGYEGVFVSKKTGTKIAIVAIGYADGIFRNIVKEGYVLINDNYAKIVAICMDTMLVNVTDFFARIGDRVLIFGKDKTNQIFVCDVARWCDTISYEILTHISKRVKRKYIMQGEKICKSSQENIEQENLFQLKVKPQDQH